MWLTKKQNLKLFVSRQIPQDVELDTTNSVASKTQRASDTTCVGRSQKKSLNEAVAEAIIGYLEVKEAEALNPKNKPKSLGVELQTFMHAQYEIP
jgi:hypothetical protein